LQQRQRQLQQVLYALIRCMEPVEVVREIRPSVSLAYEMRGCRRGVCLLLCIAFDIWGCLVLSFFVHVYSAPTTSQHRARSRPVPDVGGGERAGGIASCVPALPLYHFGDAYHDMNYDMATDICMNIPCCLCLQFLSLYSSSSELVCVLAVLKTTLILGRNDLELASESVKDLRPMCRAYSAAA